MPSHITESRIHGGAYSSPEFAAIFSDSNQVQTWLDVEQALAATQAEMGIIPHEAAREIARVAKVELFDLQALGQESMETGHILVPTIRALAKACSAHWGEYVHYGVTTQDILDTGLILQIKDAWGHTLSRLHSIREHLRVLALRYQHTPMVARTHGQQALPTTFGYKVAVWLDEIDRHLERFDEAQARVLVGNLTGAVGTMAAFGAQGFEIQRRTLARLGLAAPLTSWHSARDRVLEAAWLLVQTSMTLGRVANEIYHLQRTEIDEVREHSRAGQVGSSTMPHKQNPSTVDLISALSRLVRAQMVALTDAAFQLHERDGTTWRIEWAALPELFIYAGALLTRMDGVLAAGLDVREERMRSNLDLLGGLILSERVMLALAAQFGKQTAHELVHEVSLASRRSGISFRDALLKHKRLQGCFTPQALEDLLNPATYTGLAADMVEQVARKPLSTPLHGAGEGAISTQGTLSQSQYVMEDM
ncbi:MULTISPECIES: adenylosuccinate lyase [Pseudomonas]|uniref:Adenylosuccinate lyase n=1 Tax=Pseudomonas gessardii TaxID=78544 RepID=A0ABS9F212_9PSED|nr:MULTISPECIES: adenylosuccinate lyase [Pseudomonas]MBH3421303.1 adenylosuccinate lyase [Pseudomonas gessardii]MCF4977080.1 adenylosuccinate lyase [Pseudomonas gessardii]MCF4990446.1 adenylosuccinate lyase [Pseudomonas gessardii]MCF5083061.1 adenylosuccinate lyase [Pseudomonas gessardii]MCF5095306.1 adenylosuccinate lyase [Pseudomonas gessardii]